MKLRFSGLVTTNDWQLLLPFDVDGIDLLKKSGKFEQPHCDVSYGRWWVRGTIPSWSYFRLVNDYHSSRLQYITTSRVNIGGLGILRSHRRVSSRNLHLQGIARSAEFSTAWFPSEFPLLFIWKPLSRKKNGTTMNPMIIPLFQSLTFRIFRIFWLESQPSIHHHSFCSVVSGRALRKAGAKSRGWWSRAGMVSWMVGFMENPNRKWMIWCTYPNFFRNPPCGCVWKCLV